MAAIELSPQVVLIAGAAILYAAGRGAAESLAGTDPAPGRRAFGYWLPIAAVAVAALVVKQPGLALQVVFAASVASLALLGGCVSMIGSGPDPGEAPPPYVRRSANLLLPAALLALLAGFAGHFTCLAASGLFIEGVVILFVWWDPADRPDGVKRPHRNRLGLFLAACTLPIGACAAVLGAVGASDRLDFPAAANAVAITALAPLLVAPMFLEATHLVQRKQAWAASSVNVIVAQLNLCVLLPLMAAIWAAWQKSALVYPLVNWRVDAVMLVLLAAITGRLGAGRLEGIILTGLYAAYVLAVIAVAIKQ